MVDLLMLGIVPGTNIQINFSDWLIGSAIIFGIIAVLSLIRHRVFAAALILAIMQREQHRLKALQNWTQSHSA